MKKNAPYIIVIVALAGALAWVGASYASQRSRIAALETANQNLGHADNLVANQINETMRSSLAKIPQTCANMMSIGSRFAPVRIRTAQGEFELTRVK